MLEVHHFDTSLFMGLIQESYRTVFLGLLVQNHNPSREDFSSNKWASSWLDSFPKHRVGAIKVENGSNANRISACPCLD